MTKQKTVWTLRMFYLFYYASLGTMMPYLPLLFAGRGFSSVAIGPLLSVIPLAGAIIPPFWGRLADRSGKTVRLLRWQIAFLPVLVFALFSEHGATAAGLLLVLLAIFLSAVAPLADHLTLEYAARWKIDYGRVRVFGSIGFSAANIVVTLFLRYSAVDQLDWLYIPLSICAFVITVLLPDVKGAADVENASWQPASKNMQAERRSPWRHLSPFYLATFVTALTVPIYTTFFPLFAKRVGLPQTLVPLAFTLSSGSELLTMPFASRLYRFIGPMGMLALATGVYAIRWAIIGISGGAWPTLVIQVTHGISFGFWYTGTVMYLRDAVDLRFRATGQTIFAAVSGAGNVLGTSTGGVLFYALGPRGFFITEAGIALMAFAFYLLIRRRDTAQETVPLGPNFAYHKGDHLLTPSHDVDCQDSPPRE